jgi:hypothetical protein
MLAEARYDKELESPYEGAEQTLRALSPATGSGLSRISPLAQRNG